MLFRSQSKTLILKLKHLILKYCLSIFKTKQIPIDQKSIIYNYSLIKSNEEENTKSNRIMLNKTVFKFLSFNIDKNVFILEKEDDYYAKINFDREDQSSISSDFISQDYKRLSSLTQQLLDSIGQDLLKPDMNETQDAYGYLEDYFSADCKNCDENFDGTIIEHELIESDESNLINLVQTPYRRMDKTEINCISKISTNINKCKAKDLNNNNLKTLTNSDLALINWIRDLKSDSKNSQRRSLPLNLEELVPEYTMSEDEDQVYKSRPNERCLDENVLALRNTLFSFVNTSLKNLIISPLKLANLRRNLVYLLKKNELNSVEQFVLEIFEFFSENLFFKLLQSVKIEWSYRLRS